MQTLYTKMLVYKPILQLIAEIEVEITWIVEVNGEAAVVRI